MPQRQRFARESRLRDAGAFRRVFQKPRRSSDELFTVLARSNHLGHARLGLAIAKKALPLATARNRVKRIVRECFRQNQRLLEGLDVVVLARNGLGRSSNQQMAASLNMHWHNVARQCRRS